VHSHKKYEIDRLKDNEEMLDLRAKSIIDGKEIEFLRSQLISLTRNSR